MPGCNFHAGGHGGIVPGHVLVVRLGNQDDLLEGLAVGKSGVQVMGTSCNHQNVDIDLLQQVVEEFLREAGRDKGDREVVECRRLDS